MNRPYDPLRGQKISTPPTCTVCKRKFRKNSISDYFNILKNALPLLKPQQKSFRGGYSVLDVNEELDGFFAVD